MEKLEREMMIMDVGSSTTKCVIIGENGEILLQLKGVGFNPSTQDEMSVKGALWTLCKEENEHAKQIKNIYLYGAGIREERKDGVEKIIRDIWRTADVVEVESDMLGACRAMCGMDEGVCGILGTGANSCFYDGIRITEQTPVLGYILGDEGSGTSLGKRLLGEVLRHRLSVEIEELFWEEYHITVKDVIENVYRKEGGNRYIASFVPFIVAHVGHREIEEMVKDEFGKFYEKNIMRYNGGKIKKVGFVGSVAWHLREILIAEGMERGIQEINIEQSPIKGLIQYHRRR